VASPPGVPGHQAGDSIQLIGEQPPLDGERLRPLIQMSPREKGKGPMDARYRLAAVVSTCVLVLFAFASPARAHDIRINGPFACGVPKFSMCGYAQVRDNHEIVDACDTRADGDGYFVRYRVRSGAVGTVGDGNGSAAGCGIKRVGSPTIPIVAFQGCTDQNLWPRNNCLPWETA
jgi:hypothetical protein